jgi:hypothetical protein
MNKRLKQFARDTILNDLLQLTDAQQAVFKKMYSPDPEKFDTYPLKGIVGIIYDDLLENALDQTERTLENNRYPIVNLAFGSKVEIENIIFTLVKNQNGLYLNGNNGDRIDLTDVCGGGVGITLEKIKQAHDDAKGVAITLPSVKHSEIKSLDPVNIIHLAIGTTFKIDNDVIKITESSDSCVNFENEAGRRITPQGSWFFNNNITISDIAKMHDKLLNSDSFIIKNDIEQSTFSINS